MSAMISYSTNGPVASAVLNRPEKLNAMPRDFWKELRDVVERVESDAAVRVLGNVWRDQVGR